jgi:hypothetical protein
MVESETKSLMSFYFACLYLKIRYSHSCRNMLYTKINVYRFYLNNNLNLFLRRFNFAAFSCSRETFFYLKCFITISVIYFEQILSNCWFLVIWKWELYGIFLYMLLRSDIHKYYTTFSPTQLDFLLLMSIRETTIFGVSKRHLQVFYWTNSVLECYACVCNIHNTAGWIISKLLRSDLFYCEGCLLRQFIQLNYKFRHINK